jgi:hypothetical protein
MPQVRYVSVAPTTYVLRYLFSWFQSTVKKIMIKNFIYLKKCLMYEKSRNI